MCKINVFILFAFLLHGPADAVQPQYRGTTIRNIKQAGPAPDFTKSAPPRIVEKLKEFRSELMALVTAKHVEGKSKQTGGYSLQKIRKIKKMKKKIAGALAQMSRIAKLQAIDFYKGTKWTPLNLRPKLTRKQRRMLTASEIRKANRKLENAKTLKAKAAKVYIQKTLLHRMTAMPKDLKKKLGSLGAGVKVKPRTPKLGAPQGVFKVGPMGLDRRMKMPEELVNEEAPGLATVILVGLASAVMGSACTYALFRPRFGMMTNKQLPLLTAA
eukprot:gnl/MRDRNA2_/MRDRNA2_147361_c0_seq1.p1 gnl/MRDRNA2_/MRDRNA2_147361_c0~~gnl/MRDRNA2_/MRDRNA2_147361_c0_seq1.p1  ORF type:complete len:271 (+),score=55.98 gnl/MRDRNA2_/MRDRNA2_147361_c0_seq1:99-911(+)